MEPAEKSSESQKPKQSQVSAVPPVEPNRPSRLKNWLSRTGSSFTAEYSIFLIVLGVSLSNLVWLVYLFFGLIVDAMNGGAMSSFVPTHMFALWLLISSAVTLSLTYILWCRIQGELATNQDYKGDLPNGAAKGFRTFWIILSVLGMAGLGMAAVYAPLAAALSGGLGAQMLLSVTVPSLINVAISGVGIYLVTRGVHQRKRSHLLLIIVAALTAVLFITDYLWASNAKPSRTTPSYTRPSSDYDAYDDIYDDPYTDYMPPSDYR
jgi:hypothetical protein